jgi:hypothetical protein
MLSQWHHCHALDTSNPRYHKHHRYTQPSSPSIEIYGTEVVSESEGALSMTMNKYPINESRRHYCYGVESKANYSTEMNRFFVGRTSLINGMVVFWSVPKAMVLPHIFTVIAVTSTLSTGIFPVTTAQTETMHSSVYCSC